MFNEANILAFNEAKSDTSREQIPGSRYMNKISTFIESHYINLGELYMEFLKRACSEHSHGHLCDFCESHPWVGPENEQIPQPIPDPENPPHYESVFCMPERNDDGSRRDPDDW